MKWFKTVIACLGLTLVPAATLTLSAVTVSSVGCAGQSAVQTWSYSQDAYINAAGRVALLRQAGKINDQDYAQVVLMFREADAVLTQWDQAIQTGGPTVNYVHLIDAVLARIEAYILSHQ